MRSLFQLLLLCSLMASAGAAQIGKPPLARALPVGEGAENALRGGTRFGRAVLALPDLDEDGTPEFAVGAPTWPGGGAVLILSGATRQRLALWQGAERLRTGCDRWGTSTVTAWWTCWSAGRADISASCGRRRSARAAFGLSNTSSPRAISTATASTTSSSRGRPDGPFAQVPRASSSGAWIRGSVRRNSRPWRISTGTSSTSSSRRARSGSSRALRARTGSRPCEASPVVHDHWGSVFGGRGLVVDGAASGDLDGDGRSDLVISCRHRGAAFVAGLSLADRSTAIMRTPPSGPGRDPLAVSRYRFGYELLCPGDLNGDGAGDVIASGAITIFQVRVAALDAATGGELWSADWSDGGATSGVSLARFADVDGDGAAEVLVGSSDWFWHGVVVPNGTVRLLSGATGEPLWVVGERRYRSGGIEAVPDAREKR